MLDLLISYSTKEEDLWIHSRHIFVNGYITIKLYCQEQNGIVKAFTSENAVIVNLNRITKINSEMHPFWKITLHVISHFFNRSRPCWGVSRQQMRYLHNDLLKAGRITDYNHFCDKELADQIRACIR